MSGQQLFSRPSRAPLPADREACERALQLAHGRLVQARERGDRQAAARAGAEIAALLERREVLR